MAQVMVLTPFVDMANHSAEGSGRIRFDVSGITLAYEGPGDPGSEVRRLTQIGFAQSGGGPLTS
eukprot:447659-Pyramimonas_sp.AAC.1